MCGATHQLRGCSKPSIWPLPWFGPMSRDRRVDKTCQYTGWQDLLAMATLLSCSCSATDGVIKHLPCAQTSLWQCTLAPYLLSFHLPSSAGGRSPPQQTTHPNKPNQKQFANSLPKLFLSASFLKERGRTICTNSSENCLRKLFLLGWVVLGWVSLALIVIRAIMSRPLPRRCPQCPRRWNISSSMGCRKPGFRSSGLAPSSALN